MELICCNYLCNNRFELPLHDLPRLNGMYYRRLGPSQVILAPLYTIIGAKVWNLIGQFGHKVQQIHTIIIKNKVQLQLTLKNE